MQTFLESSMLICFSVGWYMSIAKMLVTRIAAGKSACFVLLVALGYAAGVGAKLFEAAQTGRAASIVWLYGWNMCVCLFDLFLVVLFTRHPGLGREHGNATATVPSNSV